MSTRPRVPLLKDRFFQEPRARPLMAELPRVVGVCRRIWGTKPVLDLVGTKVRPNGISGGPANRPPTCLSLCKGELMYQPGIGSTIRPPKLFMQAVLMKSNEWPERAQMTPLSAELTQLPL